MSHTVKESVPVLDKQRKNVRVAQKDEVNSDANKEEAEEEKLKTTSMKHEKA